MQKSKNFILEEVDGHFFPDQATAQSKVLQPLVSSLVYTLRGLIASGTLIVSNRRIIRNSRKVRK